MATYGVTGVARGIGAALARVLTGQGHRVVGFDRRETAENLARFVPLDLADPAAAATVAAAVDEPLDGLCNNAGLPPREGNGPAVLTVNFLGTRAFTRAIRPHLAPGAAVVTIASRAGQHWRDGLDQVKRLAALATAEDAARFAAEEGIDATRCYNLTKEAVIVWTMAMAEDLAASGLRAVSVSPAAVETGILDDFKRAFGARVDQSLARVGRPGRPEEIAAVAAFALSPAARWLNGADIPVDGGIGAFALSDKLGLAPLKG